ncbi:MAG: class I SAM-dependent methyltransferase [Lachnospiraceae bacterium]
MKKSKTKIWLIGGILILTAGLINYLVNQSRNPEGFVGKAMTKIWSSYFTDQNQWGYSLINIDEVETSLDVGFGGGSGIKYRMNQNPDRTVYGIDISDEAVETAAEINKEYVDSGNVILKVGDVAALPFDNNFFDLVAAGQTHIYWDELEKGLSECRRVLKEDGTLLITCEIDKIKYHLSEYENSDDFVSLLYTIGYREVNVTISINYIAFICTK